MSSEPKTYPEGHLVGLWIGIMTTCFSGVGLPLAIATDSMGLMGIGPAIGAGVGVAIGTSIEQQHEQRGLIRPRTEAELGTERRALRRVLVLVGIVLLAVVGTLVVLAS